MDFSIRLIALSGVCVLIGACSTTRPAVAPAPAPSEATTSVRRIHLEDKNLTNDEIKALFEQGYKPSGRNGEVYYCRREQQLGTRFETTICRTAEQMKQLEQDSKSLAADKQRPSGCSSVDHGTTC